MQSKPSGTWAVVRVTPADPSGAVPRDGALSVGSRRCCQQHCQVGKVCAQERQGKSSVHTGKAGETAATVQTVGREKQSAGCGQTGRAGRKLLLQLHHVLHHTGPFAEGVLLSYEIVINAKFLSLFSLWLGFIIEIKDRR